MNLKYSFSDISKILGEKNSTDTSLIKAISFDSRKIISGRSILFFALKGNFRDGHDYIKSSYNKNEIEDAEKFKENRQKIKD